VAGPNGTLNGARTTPERRTLNPDRPAWDRQAEETDSQWAAFERYRDMEKRSLRQAGGNATNWSSQWSWAYRVAEWDRYIVHQEAEALVRYRVDMNERHRNISRLLQSKVVQWLQNVDPNKMSASEATRALDVATRLERLAAGAEAAAAAAAEDLPDVPDGLSAQTLGEMLNLSPAEEAEVARQLHMLAGS
jgi:Lon protease-like protein